MKRLALIFLLALDFSLLTASGQEMKPCGTSVFARRHQLHKRDGSSCVTRATQKEPSLLCNFQGEKRGLIILVSFPDQAFSDEDPKTLWTAIANEEGYQGHGARGSISDYFRDQSYGQFKLTFDVAGPVEAKHPYGYYGENIDWGEPTGWFDRNVAELVEEACRGVADEVSFADYDWDGDGNVEQVFLLYAGHGENDYWVKDSTVIWPHMAMLSLDWGYEEGLVQQGVRIDAYACSNEVNRSNGLAGLGSICHEFSHCLGLPDLYNTETGRSVVGSYDLMDRGSYNGNGWCPAGYSSYERYACGWLMPQATEDARTVETLAPLHEQPDVRIYRTSPEAGDYYLVECREKALWDSYLPTAGMTAWHVDYDETAWEENTVNNDPQHLRVERMPLGDVPAGILSVPAETPHHGFWYDLQGKRLLFKPSAPGLYIHNGKKESIR
jgi:M6 family metalloprotease-like protein